MAPKAEISSVNVDSRADVNSSSNEATSSTENTSSPIPFFESRRMILNVNSIMNTMIVS